MVGVYIACRVNGRRFTVEQTTVSELLGPLETWWDDYARSMRRRNMSARTAHLYRRAYLRFWVRRQDFLTLRGKTGLRVVPIFAATGEPWRGTCAPAPTTRPPSAPTPCGWAARGRSGDSGISQLLARRCKLAGLPRINPHRFRHTFAHQFRAQGGDPVDLMYLSGWKTLAMTERYGAATAAERARNAHRRMGLGDRL
jgi:Phage integrase family